MKEYKLFASVLDNPAEVCAHHRANIALDDMFSSQIAHIMADSANEAIERFAESCVFKVWAASKQTCWFYGIDDAGAVRFAAHL